MPVLGCLRHYEPRVASCAEKQTFLICLCRDPDSINEWREKGLAKTSKMHSLNAASGVQTPKYGQYGC